MLFTILEIPIPDIMKIILIGNIGVGKTTIARKLLEKYKEADFVSIDEMRRRYGDGSTEKENYCKERFIKAIDFKAKIQVIELTGVGVLGERLFELLSIYQYPILVFHLIVPIDKLLKRVKKKVWDIPFPIGKDNIPVAIRYTEDRYNEGLIYSLVKKCPNSTLVSLSNDRKIAINENLRVILGRMQYLLKK